MMAVAGGYDQARTIDWLGTLAYQTEEWEDNGPFDYVGSIRADDEAVERAGTMSFPCRLVPGPDGMCIEMGFSEEEMRCLLSGFVVYDMAAYADGLKVRRLGALQGAGKARMLEMFSHGAISPKDISLISESIDAEPMPGIGGDEEPILWEAAMSAVSEPGQADALPEGFSALSMLWGRRVRADVSDVVRRLWKCYEFTDGLNMLLSDALFSGQRSEPAIYAGEWDPFAEDAQEKLAAAEDELGIRAKVEALAAGVPLADIVV